MPFNKSPLHLEDVRRLMDRALVAPKGLKVRFDSHGEAVMVRSRANYLRSQDRKLNETTYPPEHEMHRQSVWDALHFVVKGAELTIVKGAEIEFDVEEIA